MSTQECFAFFEAKPTPKTLNPIREHIRSMRRSWPEWKGPKVCDGVNGRLSVGACIVKNITEKCYCFHYTEPCKIIEIGPRLQWIRAMIDFPANAPEHCLSKNGQIVELEFDEIWPPVQDINAQHRITIH